MQSISFSHITSLYEFDGIFALDSDLGGYRSQFCRISNSGGEKLTIRSGTYLRSYGKMGEFSTHQQEKFRSFLNELKTHLAHVDPNLPVKTGSKIVLLVCSIVLAVGMFLCFCGILPFVSDEDAAQSLVTKMSLLIFFLSFGGGICWWSARSGFAYVPRQRPVSMIAVQHESHRLLRQRRRIP